jgi:superfamily II DNA or RNA helicase
MYIWYKDNTWVYINVKDFIKIKDSFECKNLKKIQDMNMNLWGWQKLPDIIKHYERVWRDLVKVPMGILWVWGDKFEDKVSYNWWLSSQSNLEVKEIIPEEDIDQDLREKQLLAIDKLTKTNVWYLHASTACGKTFICAKVIEKFQTKTLIVCSWIELMNQMAKDIEGYFWIKPLTISGKKTKQKNTDDRIVIWNIDSLIKLPKEELDKFWLILLDELDKYLQAERRLKWVSSLSSNYLYWLTGTIKLNHVDNKIFDIYLWPKTELIIKNFIPKIYKVLTEFTYSEWELDDLKRFHILKNELYFNEDRNNLIVSTIKNTLWLRKWIVFCEYVEHSKIIAQKLESEWIKTFMLIWEIEDNERKRIKQELKDYKWPCVLIWSVRIIWRWFNVPELSVWYLTTTEKFTSSIEQYLGRILRQFPWKTWCDWYDFVDTNPSILLNQSRSRTTTYKREFPWCKIEIF